MAMAWCCVLKKVAVKLNIGSICWSPLTFFFFFVSFFRIVEVEQCVGKTLLGDPHQQMEPKVNSILTFSISIQILQAIFVS